MIGLRASAGLVLLGILLAATPLLAGDGYNHWHSEGWYAERAGDPPGTRQVEKYGKLWPPFPRPVGPHQTFWHKYHHAHYWPHPYNYEDRAYCYAAVQQQTQNGWSSATTLHDYHFDPETNRLNSAGETHLYWILTQAPACYRTTYIAHAKSQEVDQVRVAQVESAARMMVGNEIPPILLKHETTIGRPAVEIDTLRKLELQSFVRPRLFIVGTAGAGGGASSSSQAGGATGQAQLGGAGGVQPSR